MDKDVINLAKAIRQAETGNKPVAGKSGELKSRYQFLPSTWKSWSKQYLGIDNAPLTLENENKVAYSKIKELKDKGLNPAQIASVWNSGSTKWEGKVGVNKQGVKYDVPLYVNRVYSEYQKIKGVGPATGASLRSQYEQRQPQPQTVEEQRAELQNQGLPVAKDPTRVNPTFGGMIARDILKTPAKMLENVKAIPKILQGQSFQEATAPKESKYFGGTIAPLGTRGNFGQNLKESIGAGAEIASYLPFGEVVTGTAKVLKAGAKTFGKQAVRTIGRRIVGNAVEGFVGTAMFEGGKRLQGEKDRGSFGGALAYGTGGAVGLGVLGGALSRGVRQGRRTLSSIGGKIPEDIAEESTQRLKGAWTELNDNYKDLRNFRNKQAKYGRNIEDVLTEEVLVPEIKDGKVDVQKLLPEIDRRIQQQAEQVTEFAKRFDDIPVPIKDVEAIAEKVIRETESITATGELKSALSEVARRMEGIKEVYGETLVPSQLNIIRMQMNQLTEAFGGDVFKQDVADAIADAVREKLDEVIQDDVFRRANAKVGDLINVRKYLQKVDGKQVGGGRFSQAFAGVVGAVIGGDLSKGGVPILGPAIGTLVGRKIVRGARQYAFGSAGPRTRAILRRMQRKNEVGAEIAEKTTKKKQLLLPARTSDNNVRLESGRPINLPPRSQSSVDKTEMANRALEKIKVGDNIKIDGKEMEVTRKVADGVVAKDDGGIKKFIPKEQLGEQAFGAVAGIQTDEDGNLTFDKKSALAGVAGLAVAKKAGILPKAGVYKGEKDLTTKILKDLEGKTTVSKQYILDATNRGELKQVERDLIRDILERETPKIEGVSDDLLKEARKYKSAEEFVKAQPKLFHGGTADIQEIKLGKSNFQKTFYMSDNADYAKSYGGSKSSLNEISLDKNANLADMRKPNPDLIKKIEKAISGEKTGKIIKIKKPDGSYVDVPEIKGGSSNAVYSNSAIIQGLKDGKAMYAELPEVKQALKKLGYDGQITAESKFGSNYGVWNKDVLKTKSQLEEIWKKAKGSDTINVSDFAKKVKAELLPLKVSKSNDIYYNPRNPTKGRYENIALPDEVRGSVKDYKENIYQSPIKTSAGNTHFGGEGADSYFGHTRIEDMADNKTRRVIEVQSDLYQKGNLEREGKMGGEFSEFNRLVEKKNYFEGLIENPPKIETDYNPNFVKETQKELDIVNRNLKKYEAEYKARQAEVAKLQQYNDPTAHFRMIREEIKKAAEDGKTKLQFPTGETAMKIEGLGSRNNWVLYDEFGENLDLTEDLLQVGKEVKDGASHWIITDVLGDGKFKAVPKDKWDNMDAGVFLYSSEEKRLNELWGKNQSTLTQAEKAERDALFAKADQLKETYQFNREIPDTETFDISGKVDTNNPIYKFYEKDVQKYLNKFGGKRVVDDKGVSWIEVPIKKEWAKMPVEAFALFPLFGIGKEKVIEDNDEYTTTKSGLFGNKISVTRKNIPELQPVEKPILEQSRNVIIKKEDINELKAILFGEISNRDISKKELEVRVILNTVLNRVKQNKDRGKDKSVTDVLTQKNQYQAYQGQQYDKYLEGDLDDLGKKKKEELDKIVEKIIAEIESGTFEDNTNGAVFYIHNPDGTITYRSGSLFK